MERGMVVEYRQYELARDYVAKQMKRSPEDWSHTQRVLNNALRILENEPSAESAVVILAALLHDVGRREAKGDKIRSHAEIGAEIALAFLLEHGFDEDTAQHVSDCILTHSLRGGLEPGSLEARILFDADKLDQLGASGALRCAILAGQVREPAYRLGEDGLPAPGKKGEEGSLLRDCRQRLRKLPGSMYTRGGRKMAEKRLARTEKLFAQAYAELRSNYKNGQRLLSRYIEE